MSFGATTHSRAAALAAQNAVCRAAEAVRESAERMLLERGGADPNVGTAGGGMTPLFWAAQYGHLDTVKVLVEAGTRPWVAVQTA